MKRFQLGRPTKASKPKAARANGSISERAVLKAPKDLTVDSLSLDGRGVARYQGKAVFVRGALPTEQVSVKSYRRHKRFDECEVRDVLKSSEQRSEPDCSHYGRCGGCQLQHLNVDAQLQLKQQAVLELLQRQADIVPESVVEPIQSSPWGYRSRARIAVDKAGQLSFRQIDSDQYVNIQQCQVLDKSLQVLLPELQQWLTALAEQSRSVVAVTHIELIALESGVALVIRHPQAVEEAQRLQLESCLAPLIDGELRLFWQGGKKARSKTGKQKKDGPRDVNDEELGSEFGDAESSLPPLENSAGQVADEELVYSLPSFGLSLNFLPNSFTQVNSDVNQAMVMRALEWLQLGPQDRVADLFCGVGNFSLALATQAGSVVAIEAVESMVEQGRRNASRQGMDNVTFKVLDLQSDDLGERLNQLGVNSVLLDPPRSGAQEVCKNVAQSGAKSVLYVSCNPQTLVRDAALMKAQGYRMQHFCVLDMFPHTAHIESMALFSRGK